MSYTTSIMPVPVFKGLTMCVCVGVSCTLTKKIPKNIPQRSKTSHREMSQVRAVREGLPKEVMLELRNV